MTAFRSLASAMVKIFYRDKATLFFTFVFPLMFLVVFGLLFRDAGESKTEIGVVGDGPVIVGLEQTGALELKRFDTVDEAVRQVREGELPAMVAQDGDEVTFRFAQSDQTQASVVSGIVTGVVSHVTPEDR
jgi:ABC-2 type transport system permease protein